MTLALTLFIAGMLTILLPCILPLIPIVLGVSIAGTSRWRPLLTIAGMLVSFVGFTFLLQLVLSQFVFAADYMRTATYYILLLFGAGFSFHDKQALYSVTALGALFFWDDGLLVVGIALTLGLIAMFYGSKVAAKLQTLGANVQSSTQKSLGQDNPITAFIIGLTMGLVWVPCAGPALGFAFTLVREQPGVQAFFYLLCYGLGTAVPLTIIGYGGQYAVHSVRALSKYSGRIKQVSGYILLLTALSFQFGWFKAAESWLVSHTALGNIGVDLETKFFGEEVGSDLLD